MRTSLEAGHCNPYGCGCGHTGNAGLVDKYIGTAYDTVKCVHDNLAVVKQVSFYMEDLLKLANKLDALKTVTDSLDGLQSLDQTQIANLRQTLLNITEL